MKHGRGAPSRIRLRINQPIRRRENPSAAHLTNPDIDVVHKKCSRCAAAAVNRLVLLDSLSRRLPGTPVWTCQSHVAEVQASLAAEAERHGYRLVVSPLLPAIPAPALPQAGVTPQSSTTFSVSREVAG